jgi:hypothetical protein
MFSTCHQPLVDDLCCIVSSRIDMDTLLNHGIRSRSERLPGLVSACLDLGLALLTLLGIGVAHAGKRALGFLRAVRKATCCCGVGEQWSAPR